MADNLLLKYRIQHTLHCRFNILNRLINYLIQSYIHALALCRSLRLCIGTHVKADNNRIRCRRQNNIRLINRSDTAVNTFYDNLLI